MIYYTNSFLASVVSVAGCGLAIGGVLVIKEGEVGLGIILFLLAVPFLIGGKRISENKAFKKWWKQVENANLIPQIVNSAETAMEIYKKNPQKRTLEEIRKLNPIAAAAIENGGSIPVQQPQKQREVPKTQPVQHFDPIQKTQPVQHFDPIQKTQPVQQPQKPAQQAAAKSAVDQVIDEVVIKSNANKEKQAHIYWECAMRLEDLYTNNPNHQRLQQNLAQSYTNYAGNIKDFTYDGRKKAINALFRALEVEKNPPQDKLDNRIHWLYVHTIMASIDAGNTVGTREQMQEARTLLRRISGYRMQNPNEKAIKLMDVALPVARCRIASRLAKKLTETAPVNLNEAMNLCNEAVRLCPMDVMRQCDLNPYLDSTAVVMTRQDILTQRAQVYNKLNG